MEFNFQIANNIFSALIDVDNYLVLVTNVIRNQTVEFKFDYLNAHYPLHNIKDTIYEEVERIFYEAHFYYSKSKSF